MTDSTLTRGKIFVEDLAIANGGTGAVETGTRLTSTGGVITLTKLDLSHIPYRNYSSTPEDLLDGGQDVDILPKDIDAGGNANIDGTLTVGGETTLSTLSSEGYVKNDASGVLSTGTIEIADLPTAIPAANIGNGDVDDTVLSYINTVASNVQDQINTIIAGGTVWPSFALLQNRQNQNTDGGTATSGAWRIIPLNVEQEDADNIVDSSALPAFSLAAGTYRFKGVAPFWGVGSAQIRLYNIDDSTADGIGTSAYSGTSSGSDAYSFLRCTVTIAGTKQFRLEYQVNTSRSTNGLGRAGDFDSDLAAANKEVYAQIEIIKMA